ncbi:hypothetical protein L1987_15251 [Smallanthus sonchifolius]|uniref:Uncharacterized protein n=1 Tax=Smallanthus sonchifolius TaxID=185202 RepID=A0ACB9J5L1_9ASTR|nr:hypothetical protein L1987_15251 [Smallanthus sonchifolius]
MGVCQLQEVSSVVLDEADRMHTSLLLSTMLYIIIHEVSQISSLEQEETQDSEFRIKVYHKMQVFSAVLGVKLAMAKIASQIDVRGNNMTRRTRESGSAF